MRRWRATIAGLLVAVLVLLRAPMALAAVDSVYSLTANGTNGKLVVELSWRYQAANTADMTFNIYRKTATEGASWCLYDTVHWSASWGGYARYFDESPYYQGNTYQVTLVSGGGETVPSNTASATPASGLEDAGCDGTGTIGTIPGVHSPPPTPTGLAATGGAGTVTIAWQYSSTAADTFRVYKSTNGGASWRWVDALAVGGGGTYSWTDTAPLAQSYTQYAVAALSGREPSVRAYTAGKPTSGGGTDPGGGGTDPGGGGTDPGGGGTDPGGGGTSPANPDPPVGLVATGGAGTIGLAWQYPATSSTVNRFVVYRSIDGGTTWCLFEWVPWDRAPDITWYDTAPAAGQATMYYVTAFSSDGYESGRSNTAAAVPTSGGVTSPTCGGGGDPVDPGGGGGDPDPGGGGGSAPPPPYSLEAQIRYTRVRLQWLVHNLDLYERFNIYRDGVLWGDGALGSIWEESGLTPGQTYRYTVTGVYGGGRETAPIGPVEVTAEYEPPGYVAVTGQAVNGRVDLAWSPPTEGGPVTGYRVYRDGKLVTTTDGLSWSGQYQDGYAHTWTVRAYGPGGEGWSAPVSSLVHPVVDYLQRPDPVPPPPSVPLGPGYTPPPAPDLTPIMPQLGRRTGRTLPPVPTLQVPADIPAPPALPPVEEPPDSPWGLPIGTPGTAEEPPAPVTPGQASDPLAPSGPVSPSAPLTPSRPVSPSGPLTPEGPLSPSGPLTPSGPLVPAQPLTPTRPEEVP